ncbi:helix-turn-helix domain-containing protein [Pseudomonas sp. PDM32]|uniref:transcriptional regulator n=1 Tax=Pseudomonas sp. PDM32 TaxID=2854768 RepID=UPI001C446D43|nr:YdaS family helix-turn-helix protein [Pseudomonas sp. PDM32]MBV7571826.1 helix-turn-helix domain-containing protein [Pseudomonas sp. PDM32]
MNINFKKLVEHFGSQAATAAALNVKQGSVSGWVRGLHGCSAEVALRAEVLTGGKILARDLRPSLSGQVSETALGDPVKKAAA